MEVGYVRTSLHELVPENQIQALKKKGIEKIFVDPAISGITDAKKRKGFSEMLEYIQLNSTDSNNEIWISELSRIGRTFIDVLTTVADLEKQGINVFSLSPKESWLNTADENIRQLIMAIFIWVAERERDLLVERTKLGMARARKEGKHIGRPPRKIDWKEYKKWREKGLSASAIGRIMDIPYPTLMSPRYKKLRGE